VVNIAAVLQLVYILRRHPVQLMDVSTRWMLGAAVMVLPFLPLLGAMVPTYALRLAVHLGCPLPDWLLGNSSPVVPMSLSNTLLDGTRLDAPQLVAPLMLTCAFAILGFVVWVGLLRLWSDGRWRAFHAQGATAAAIFERLDAERAAAGRLRLGRTLLLPAPGG
jgi:hypothetical protein